MSWTARVAILTALAALGCSGPPEASSPSAVATPVWEPEGPTTPVTLPNGFQLEAELRLSPEEQASGMMFRPALPPDKGMLFVFQSMEPRAFWMLNTPAPLDMIWMDDNKRIVEMSENTPPCTARDARECPSFGGAALSVYVLEAGAGLAARHGLAIGDQLQF